MANPLVEFKNVKKRFAHLIVLDGVSLKVERGESVVIIGASGSGKSVLLKHIVGLLRPDDGEVYFDGVRIDLLFTDMIMPGAMNGRQLADAALQRRASLKILFTSGYSNEAIIHHGHLDVGVLLLAKPYRKSDLARMLRAALAA